MRTSALEFPATRPPWQKPTSVIRVLRRPRPEPKRVPAAAVNRPQSKWTVVIAIVLSVALHIAPVAIIQMSLEERPVEFAQSLDDKTSATSIGGDSTDTGL